MKVENYQFPKSSFLSVEKDFEIIISQMLKNQRFQKLLYYPVEDALERSSLSPEQSAALFTKNILMVPKVPVDESIVNYVIINFDNFTPNGTNPEFRDNLITFDILCNFDNWRLQDFQLRPYRIAAEIDTMFEGRKLTGIGKLEFMGASQLIINEKIGGISLIYQAIHGGEDQVGMPNPEDEAAYIQSFNQLFNSK